VVANSQAYGGGMRVAPEALLDDGLLDVIAIEEVGKLRFLANLPRVFKGTHVRLASVKVLRAAEVEISSDRQFTLYADGDPIGELPLRVRSAPGAITMLVPAAAAAPGGAFSSVVPGRDPPASDGQPPSAVAPAGPPPTES